ncbi:hypothetical protein OHS70_22625 [Streptomyces sp. NBC_00390]|uniref:hypothetical protein n=1 Tax=Streptomyces sp. NBC_00390 TaxID=2975736 RepID=UPI002E234E6D
MTGRSLAARLLPPFAGCCAIAATLLLPDGSPLRALVAVFLLAGPGAAVVHVCAPALRRQRPAAPAESWDTGFERDSGRLELLVLAVFLSVSAAVICATALLAADVFSGLRVLVVLTALSAVAACVPRPAAGGGRAPAARASSPPQKGSAT